VASARASAAEGKRRAMGNYFSDRICYMFLISKCRGDRDLGLCTTSVLAFGEPQCDGKIRGGKRVLTFKKRILPFQFTTHSFDLFVVETNRFVSSTVNVILTRQTCGQRSSQTAESKRRALGNYFSGQICCMFQKSKCRGDLDPDLCTTSGLAFGEL